jgi:ABC-type Fe3+-hydroxamate transport system substrate-binding protein
MLILFVKLYRRNTMKRILPGVKCLSYLYSCLRYCSKKVMSLFAVPCTFVVMKQIFIDQLGWIISISFPLKRIISLVPSQTELLFDLGLDEEIAGITKFCIHPADKVRFKTKIGGTKKLDLEKIRQLQPDLIIGNKEENDKEQIEQLMQEFPVWMSDINNLDTALDMIKKLGNVVNRVSEAEQMATEIAINFDNLKSIAVNQKSKIPHVAYFIWKDPYMVAGNNTFIDDMIQRAGWKNAIESDRYPELSANDIYTVPPDVILLSSEPYPFKERHIEEFKTICPHAEVFITNGELFSWYGSRLRLTPEYLIYLTSLFCKH